MHDVVVLVVLSYFKLISIERHCNKVIRLTDLPLRETFWNININHVYSVQCKK